MSTAYAPALESATTIDRQEMILNHLPSVRMIARGVASGLPVHVNLDDLIQAGTLGLITAVRKYDPERTVAFATYAKFRIRGAMLDSLRELDWASRDLRRQHRQIQAAMHNLRSSLHREPNDEEIAGKLGVSLAKIQTTMTALYRAGLLASTRVKHEEDGPPLEISDKPAGRPDNICARLEMQTVLATAMKELPERFQNVLKLYYTSGMTMKEIGRKFVVNESRVSQIHKTALDKMAKVLRANGIQSSQELLSD